MRKPTWLAAPIGCGAEFQKVSKTISSYGLHTVCDSARCPNKGECWSAGTATFLILGDVCTRACRFCAVKTGASGADVEGDEPVRLAEAARALDLSYVVITSVDRDDLTDLGAGHYADCIRALKGAGLMVEALIPDYKGEGLEAVASSRPDMLAHNIEVVRELEGLRDSRASYDGSIETLRQAGGYGLATKSSIILGLGETKEQVETAMADLRDVGCGHLVLGQYLQPTRAQAPVKEYVRPEEFERLGEKALDMGFSHVVSKPLARTSYMAHMAFKR